MHGAAARRSAGHPLLRAQQSSRDPRRALGRAGLAALGASFRRPGRDRGRRGRLRPSLTSSTLPRPMGEFTYEGYRLSYDEYGSGDRPLILIHGLLMNRHMFERL